MEPPSPEEQSLFEAMRHDPALAERFFGVVAGTVAVEDFFSSLAPAA
jgi:hypothetical protein